MPTSSSHLLHVVGIGLDGLAGLGPEAIACLQSVKVIGGSPTHLQHVADFAVETLPMGSDIGVWMEQVAAKLDTQSVVVLASGDPLFYGLGRLLTERFERRSLRFYPHVSSVQLAFNRLGIPWQSATVVSVHGRAPDQLEQAIKQGKSPIGILTDYQYTPGAIAHLIQTVRPPINYRLWVCSCLGSAQEQIEALDLTGPIPATILEHPFAQPNVVILEKQSQGDAIAPQTQPLFGIADADFHTFADQPGLITKQEIRALSLSLLQLRPGITVWDVGAGTGSLSVEISRLVPDAQVYAIEQNAAGLALIRKNCDRFGCSNLHAIAGTAPDVLADLPVPDRVILGGGGKRIDQIISLCCQQLRPNGVLVAHFATLETCMTAQSTLRQQGWTVELLQVNVARSAPLATTQTTRFVPLNPVLLLRALPPHL
ncbi:MAG: precorrin-6y C5,15-methyltransferase (decarboxylating) subunit CbiE [Cyanothece sp. SIO2G6]|nr:precorrin-6y C5,15-methyltransferase (decarboxylating) subunit CbiE [Cyanothece sp. SIO2G6]